MPPIRDYYHFFYTQACIILPVIISSNINFQFATKKKPKTTKTPFCHIFSVLYVRRMSVSHHTGCINPATTAGGGGMRKRFVWWASGGQPRLTHPSPTGSPGERTTGLSALFVFTQYTSGAQPSCPCPRYVATSRTQCPQV